jgi:hypothetical protein
MYSKNLPLVRVSSATTPITLSGKQASKAKMPVFDIRCNCDADCARRPQLALRQTGIVVGLTVRLDAMP